jgi:hypothetical protein
MRGIIVIPHRLCLVSINSKGILFTIYRHKTQPVRNYNYAPHKSLQK